jgi:DNA-binding NtrC family response regulator
MSVERHVIVLSGDAALRDEVEAAVRGRDVRAVFTSGEEARAWHPGRVDRVVVIDDEGQTGAPEWVEATRAREADLVIIYLAAEPSLELELRVRQGGASFYSSKAARGGNVKRVIQDALRMETGRASLGRARPPPGDGPTDGA